MDVPPYVPEIWKDLKLEFTDEYIEKRKRIKKINKLNDFSNEPPPIRKKSNKYKKKNNIFKKSDKKDCLNNNSHCIIS